MKIWFFLEGHTEVHFAKNLIRQVSPSFQEREDIVDFITSPDGDANLYYCTNCRGIDNISVEIENESFRILQAGQIKVIVVCDKEKAPCFSKRIIQASNISDAQVKAMIKFVIFDPMIERYYWSYPEIIEKVLKLTYQDRYENSLDNVQVASPSTGTLSDLKELFKRHGVKYSERDFADRFFPRAPLLSGSDSAITRARNLIS